MATHADFERHTERMQAAWDEANDSTECTCGCGKEASRADGWYFANGAGPYRDECYERLAEPPEVEDNKAAEEAIAESDERIPYEQVRKELNL